ncbi:MAG: branched-chain amino acid ABC transporter permease [Phototrophicaceae bacterium]
MELFLQQNINAISLGAIYALFALGYAMVFSILGVLNLAHSAIFMWGAFVGLLALDPSKAPILMSFLIVAIPLTGIGILSENKLIQPLLARGQNIPIPLQRLLALVVRALWITALVLIGREIFAQVLPLFPETLTVNPLIALILASVAGGVLSIALEFAAFRPLRSRNADRLAQLISSIGAALILVNLAQFAFQSVYGRTEAYYPRDVALLGIGSNPIIFGELQIFEWLNIAPDAVIFGDLRIVPIRLMILVIALVLMIFLQYLVQRTEVGQQMRAVAFNERIASLLGIDVSRIYIITFFLAGAFGGIAGMLYGIAFLAITPFIGESIALVGLTAIVLGGLGSIQGALVGGFIVALIQTYSVAFGGSSYRDAIVFILLFIMLLIRPQGLFGQPEQKRA